MNLTVKTLLFSTLLSTSSLLHAASSCLKGDMEKSSFYATAYKTAKKAGVKLKIVGDLKASTKEKSKTPKDLLLNTTVKVSPKSDSGNPGRDAKIDKNFLNFKAPIEGSFKNVTDNSAEFHLTIDGTKSFILMSYEVKDNTLLLKGEMNLLAFGLHQNLMSLNKVCLALHEGVTWPVADLEFIIALSDC